MNKSRVLFLCVGNSSRSQIAEAIVNARLGERWEAFSAGSRPSGYVHPMAIQVLSELGIEHRGISPVRDQLNAPCPAQTHVLHEARAVDHNTVGLPIEESLQPLR